MGKPTTKSLDKLCYNLLMQSSVKIQMLRQNFDLSHDYWLIAQDKANRLGLELSEYITLLIEEDVDPHGPVPLIEKMLCALKLAQRENTQDNLI